MTEKADQSADANCGSLFNGFFEDDDHVGRSDPLGTEQHNETGKVPCNPAACPSPGSASKRGGTSSSMTQKSQRHCTQTLTTACASLGDTWSLSTLEETIMFMDLAGRDCRTIRASLHDLFGLDLPVTKIAAIIQSGHERMVKWQTRLLEPVYPLVHFDEIQATTRYPDATLRYSCVAIAVTLDGAKDVLGIWTTTTNSSELRHRIVTDLRQRGVNDILMILADRPADFSNAIARHFPSNRIHTALAGFIRTSLRLVSSSRRLHLGKDLKRMYQAPDLPDAERCLHELLQHWSVTSPLLARYWRDNWPTLAPLCAIPPDIRKAIAMLNVIELLNSSLRKVMRNRSLLADDVLLFQAFFLTLHSHAKKWPRTIRDWTSTRAWLDEAFPERTPLQQ